MEREPEDGLGPLGVLTVAFAGFCTFLDVYATQPLLPTFVDLFHATKTDAGLTVSASTAAVALVSPLVGTLADRMNRKRMIVGSIVALAVATLLTATASTLHGLVAWRFLQGAAVPGMYVLMLAYISEEAAPSSTGRVMASFVTGNVIGGFTGRLLAGFVVAHAGWRQTFLVLGAINLLGALITWRWLPPSRRFVPRVPGDDRAPDAWSRALLSPRLLATFAIGFCVLFAQVASFSYVVFYLSAPPFHLGPRELGAIFFVYLAGAVVTPLAGRLIDRAGSRSVLVLSLVLAAGGIALTLVPSLPVIIVGLALVCSATFVCQSASTTYLRVAAPAQARALASGLYVTAYYLGGSVGGVAPGLLWSRAGWPGCVALIASVQLTTLALALRFWR